MFTVTFTQVLTMYLKFLCIQFYFLVCITAENHSLNNINSTEKNIQISFVPFQNVDVAIVNDIYIKHVSFEIIRTVITLYKINF